MLLNELEQEHGCSKQREEETLQDRPEEEPYEPDSKLAMPDGLHSIQECLRDNGNGNDANMNTLDCDMIPGGLESEQESQDDPDTYQGCCGGNLSSSGSSTNMPS